MIISIQDAVIEFQENGDQNGEAMTLNVLGLALREARRFDETINALRCAIAVYHKIGDLYSEGPALTNLGTTLREARQYEKAITSLREAAVLFRSDQHHEKIALDHIERTYAAQAGLGTARLALSYLAKTNFNPRKSICVEAPRCTHGHCTLIGIMPVIKDQITALRRHNA